MGRISSQLFYTIFPLATFFILLVVYGFGILLQLRHNDNILHQPMWGLFDDSKYNSTVNHGKLNLVPNNIAHLIKLTRYAQNNGAGCLDGSPGAYYISSNINMNMTNNTSQNKWIIWFEGGGWCYSEQDCLQRSYTTRGSSKRYKKTFDMNSIAQLSNDKEINPLMFDWNKVRVKYCDGASYGGNRTTPIAIAQTRSGGDSPIYSRGSRYVECFSFSPIMRSTG